MSYADAGTGTLQVRARDPLPAITARELFSHLSRVGGTLLPASSDVVDALREDVPATVALAVIGAGLGTVLFGLKGGIVGAGVGVFAKYGRSHLK